MKKRLKKFVRNSLCAAVSAMLVLGNCAVSTAYAAQEELPVTVSVEPTDSVSAELLSPMELPGIPGLTDEELRNYYGSSVFIGDSIMLGFRNYSAKQKTFVHDIQFLAVGSYGANNAMKPVKGSNVHPTYKGKKYQLWDAIPLTGRTRAFILLGMNDLAVLGLEGARDKYKELIDKILETSPDLEIHIISVTYTLEGEGKKVLNNTNIAEYNTLLLEMALDNGWGYIDLCTPISDGKGNLAESCCSDGFVHLTKAAYTLWESSLIYYANAIYLTQAAAEAAAEITAE